MKRHFSIGGLFYNNKFVLIFSIVSSFVIWIIVSSTSYEKQEKLIVDIPVTIPLSDGAKEDGLRIFSGGDIKAEVTVSGNRVVMGMISKNDIQIIAKQATSSITAPGNYTLELTANKKGTLKDYEFSEPVTPNFITVSVDRVREVTFNIENEIKYSSDPAYFAAATTFSETTVTISGPESKITNISKVIAKENIDGILRSTTSKVIPLSLLDSYGAEIGKDQLTMSVTEITAVVPILLKKVVNIVPDFENLPDGLDVGTSFATVEPKSIEIAGPEESVKEMDSVKLETINFSDIDINKKSFELNINLPSGFRNIGNIGIAQLKLNMNGMKSRDISVDNFNFVNIPEGKKASVFTNNIVVRMIGPISKINSLSSSNIVASIDLKDQEGYTGSKEFPLKIYVNNQSGCWAYGKYTANVNIE